MIGFVRRTVAITIAKIVGVTSWHAGVDVDLHVAGVAWASICDAKIFYCQRSQVRSEHRSQVSLRNECSDGVPGILDRLTPAKL